MPLATRIVACRQKWVEHHVETGARKIEASIVLVGVVLAAMAALVDACGQCVDVAVLCGEYVLAQAAAANGVQLVAGAPRGLRSMSESAWEVIGKDVLGPNLLDTQPFVRRR